MKSLDAHYCGLTLAIIPGVENYAPAWNPWLLPLTEHLVITTLAAEFGNPMSESGYLTTRSFLMDDPGAGCPHERGFGRYQSRLCGGFIAACDRIFDVTQRTAHARTTPLIYRGAASNLARGLFGRFGIGH